MKGIDQHGLSNEPFKIRVKNHPGARTEDICDHLKPDAGTNDLTNNSKSLENYKLWQIQLDLNYQIAN